ncbi:MAG: Flp family type IVb pilin [Holosporaceae bacterium]|jgi:pilus assembly protein Flp/PilA|nr:Flp family type IVb pilin [Holosporaceae bacterium]
MLKKLRRFLKESKGATAIEYALIASLIAVVCIAGMKILGNSISKKLNDIGDHLEKASPGVSE